ncbi:hypothetical protein V8C86DRAFT_1353144 [Haematococcus lacustris]
MDCSVTEASHGVVGEDGGVTEASEKLGARRRLTPGASSQGAAGPTAAAATVRAAASGQLPAVPTQPFSHTPAAAGGSMGQAGSGWRVRATGQVGEREAEAESEGEEEAWLTQMRPLATHPGVVLPSPLALLALLLLPLSLWLLAVVAGVHLFEGVATRKADVQHLMLWFDLHVFRTPLGPALPFLALTLRALAAYFSPPPTPPPSRSRQGGVVGLLPHVAYLSDHLFLGASVVACLQVELVCAVSDVIKLELGGGPGPGRGGLPLWRHMAAGSAAVLSMAGLLLVSLDMHFTARHFHQPRESVLALLLGGLAFQAPLLLWIHRKWRAVHASTLDIARCE